VDALDQGRRQPSSPTVSVDRRDAVLIAAFERSRLPQALLAVDGTIQLANKAFAKLVGNEACEQRLIAETPLASLVPGLMRAIRAVHMDGKATERKARIERSGQAPLALTLWIFPLPIAGQEIHLFARVEELKAGRED